MTAATFYVYEHWRPDTDVCFYVGKGQGDRHRKMSARNKWHKSIVAKLKRLGLSVEVRFVARHLSESDAHDMERKRIASYPAGALVNLTLGGEGFQGMALSARHKENISNACRRAFATRPEMAGKISATHKGKPKSASQKDKMRQAALRRGADPKYRQMMSEVKMSMTDEVRLKISNATTAANHSRWKKMKENPELYPKIFSGRLHSKESKDRLRVIALKREAARRGDQHGLRF